MELVELINQVGFPIAAFVLMFYMCNNSIAKNTEVLHELKEVILRLVK